LILVVAAIRNESDLQFRTVLTNFVGAVGALMLLFVAVFSLRDAVEAINFLAGSGVVLLMLGLFYVGTYMAQQEANSERAYYTALGLGGYGAVLFGLGLIKSIMPESNFLVPGGLILMSMGALFGAVSIAICCDWPVVVLARRDLAAYFYSPVAYLVTIGVVLMGGYKFIAFVNAILDPRRGGEMLEPIIAPYVFELFAVVFQMFLVPVVSMRLLSEEQRTGTLEVMLTAPVNEVSLVLGKFLACWLFYMATWLPWWLFLVSLRYFGGEEFDYRPILSFNFALAASSAGMIAMGLFFSSMTSNQIIAAVLTFVGVLGHLGCFMIKDSQWVQQGGAVYETMRLINALDLWEPSLSGNISPRHLMIHFSFAVVFLFATVKVLESRRWK
jgi:ABC-type transport system involved in multi-copper enzyme maturation permease subunit